MEMDLKPFPLQSGGFCSLFARHFARYTYIYSQKLSYTTWQRNRRNCWMIQKWFRNDALFETIFHHLLTSTTSRTHAEVYPAVERSRRRVQSLKPRPSRRGHERHERGEEGHVDMSSRGTFPMEWNLHSKTKFAETFARFHHHTLDLFQAFNFWHSSSSHSESYTSNGRLLWLRPCRRSVVPLLGATQKLVYCRLHALYLGSMLEQYSCSTALTVLNHCIWNSLRQVFYNTCSLVFFKSAISQLLALSFLLLWHQPRQFCNDLVLQEQKLDRSKSYDEESEAWSMSIGHFWCNSGRCVKLHVNDRQLNLKLKIFQGFTEPLDTR